MNIKSELGDLKKGKTPTPGISSIKLEHNTKINIVAHIGNISFVLSLLPVILSTKLKMDSIIHSKKFCVLEGINFLFFKPKKKVKKINKQIKHHNDE